MMLPDERTNAASSVDSHNVAGGQSAIRQLLPLFVLIGAFGAAAAGDGLIRLGSGISSDSKLFANTSQFDEWSAIVAVVVGISFVIASFTWPSFLRVAQDTDLIAKVSAVTIYILIGAAAVFGPFLVQSRNASSSFELSYFYQRMGLLALILLAAGTGSFCGLMLLWYSQRACSGDAQNGATVGSILSTRRDLQRFFVGATVLITGAVVIIGGLRSALNADIKLNDTFNAASIPVGALILFGAFYAMLLAFVLVPAYTAWQARAASFRDHLYEIPEDGKPPKDWYEGRADLEDLLGMQLGTTSRFLAIAGILAPFIGSIITVVIPAIHS